MFREKEELLAVRSNLVLANLCAANLLRWNTNSNRNYEYNYWFTAKTRSTILYSHKIVQIFIFFSISIQYFHFPALCWWSLYISIVHNGYHHHHHHIVEIYMYIYQIATLPSAVLVKSISIVHNGYAVAVNSTESNVAFCILYSFR